MEDAPVLNGYGQPAVTSDIFAAFEFLSEGEKYVRPRNFKSHCKEMKLDGDHGALFKAIDIRKEGSFEFQDFEKVFMNRQTWSAELGQFFTTLLSCEFMFDTGLPTSLSGSEINKLLKDTKGKWQKRIRALTEFVIIYTREKVTKDTFDAEFRKVKKGWGLQLTDRRSAVVRNATLALAKLGQRRPRQMSKYTGSLIEILFECVRTKVEVISLSGIHCATSLVVCVPDPLKKLPIFSQLCIQAQSKFVDSRRVAMELITKKTDYYIETKKTIVSQVWKKLNSLLCNDKFGLRDADANVRVMSYGLMARAELLKISGVDESIRKILSGVPKRAYEDEKLRLQVGKLLPKRLGGHLTTECTFSGAATPFGMSPSRTPEPVARTTAVSFDERKNDTQSVNGRQTKSMNVHPDQAEILQSFNSAAPQPSSFEKSKSIRKLTDIFSVDDSIQNPIIRKTLAIIVSGEDNNIDQNAIEAYLAQIGIAAKLVEEAYAEYLQLHLMYEKLFERRPLGISVVIYRGNAVVSSIQDPMHSDIQLGSRIIAINGRRMDKRGYNALMKVLQGGKMPLRIRLRKRDGNAEYKNCDDDGEEPWKDDGVMENQETMLEEMRKLMSPQREMNPAASKSGIQAIKAMHKTNARAN